jgi:hypothetical protein
MKSSGYSMMPASDNIHYVKYQWVKGGIWTNRVRDSNGLRPLIGAEYIFRNEVGYG